MSLYALASSWTLPLQSLARALWQFTGGDNAKRQRKAMQELRTVKLGRVA
jgi:hypothetical protein